MDINIGIFAFLVLFDKKNCYYYNNYPNKKTLMKTFNNYKNVNNHVHQNKLIKIFFFHFIY